MKVYCVCVEEFQDDGDIYRVELFSTIENASLYLDGITDGGKREDIKGDIVEYTLDDPESGDTCYVIEDSDFTTSDEEEYSSSD